MNTDGNTDAINRHLADREAYDEQRDKEAELQDLRDEVDALAAKLAKDAKAHEKELAVWGDNYAALEAKLDQCEAERAIGITDGDVVAHMNVASLHGQLMETKANLAEVTAERDHWETVAIARQSKLQTAEAMLPRAYRAGVKTSAKWLRKQAGEKGGAKTPQGRTAQFYARNIRAMPTPTIEQLKEMLKENGDGK